MSRLGDIEFKYKKYPSKKALEKAIDKDEVDLYFDYYNYSLKSGSVLSPSLFFFSRLH